MFRPALDERVALVLVYSDKELYKFVGFILEPDLIVVQWQEEPGQPKMMLDAFNGKNESYMFSDSQP